MLLENRFNKKLLLVLFIVNFSNAQKVSSFIGLGINFDADFYRKSIFDFGGGFEFKTTKYLETQAYINYMIGGFDDVDKYNEQGMLTTLFSSNLSSLNFGISPKVKVYQNEHGDYIHLSPRYLVSSIRAVGDYLIVNQLDNTKSTREKEILTQTRHSLGFEVGAVVLLSKQANDALGFSIYYQKIDFASVYNKLNRAEREINSRGTIGFELVYYFTIVK